MYEQDLGKRCCNVSDNMPVDWFVFYSKTQADVCYLVKPDNVILRFQSMELLEDYVDELEDDPELELGDEY